MLDAIKSLLYVPSIREEMLGKVQTLDSDAFIFDLEDSVHVDLKRQARETLAKASFWENRNAKCFLVRINDINSYYFLEDVELVTKLAPDAIVIPKATPHSVAFIDQLLRSIEQKDNTIKREIKLVPLVETAFGVCNLYGICSASDRIVGVQFGAEDFTLSMGIRPNPRNEAVLLAKAQIALTCHAFGIEAIDTPYVDIEDTEGLRIECETSKSIGMTSKACIHPKHLAIINEMFAPTEEEIRQATLILQATSDTKNLGKGAFTIDGKMIDAPIIERAKKILLRTNSLSGDDSCDSLLLQKK